jgi:hypothetical protein
MKLKNIALTALSVIAFSSSAAIAQTTVTMTGSTAYRASTHAAILASFSGPYTFAYTGANATNAQAAIYAGTVAGNSVVIKTSWSGAVGGTKSVVVGTPGVRPKFLQIGGPNVNMTPSGGSGATAPTVQEVAQITMTDNLQTSTFFRPAAGYPEMTEIKVAVVPYRWVTNYSTGAFPNPITNITPLLAQALWQNGFCATALFTGNPADQATTIYATGRDPDSGTRVIAFSESGVGALAGVQQYRPVISGTVINSHALFPAVAANPADGTALPSGWPVGFGGQSGSNTADALRCTTTAAGINGWYVGYLGGVDADRALTGFGTTAGAGNAKELTWNGVAYSFDNVAEGKYTFWGYEYLCYLNSLTGVPKTTADTIANNLINLPPTDPAVKNLSTTYTLNLSDMKVVRSGDGGLVTQDY